MIHRVYTNWLPIEEYEPKSPMEVTLELDESLIEMLATEGYRPEYGARELKRQIRSLVETRLARAMLGGEVGKGDTVRLRWDATAEQIVIEPAAKPGGDDAKAGDAAQSAAS